MKPVASDRVESCGDGGAHEITDTRCRLSAACRDDTGGRGFTAARLPLDLELIGRKVVFAHPEALKDEPHLIFTALEKGDTEAVARFRYAVEGVVGEVKLEKTVGGWVVTRASISEQ